MAAPRPATAGDTHRPTPRVRVCGGGSPSHGGGDQGGFVVGNTGDERVDFVQVIIIYSNHTRHHLFTFQCVSFLI